MRAVRGEHIVIVSALNRSGNVNRQPGKPSNTKIVACRFGFLNPRASGFSRASRRRRSLRVSGGLRRGRSRRISRAWRSGRAGRLDETWRGLRVLRSNQIQGEQGQTNSSETREFRDAAEFHTGHRIRRCRVIPRKLIGTEGPKNMWQRSIRQYFCKRDKGTCRFSSDDKFISRPLFFLRASRSEWGRRSFAIVQDVSHNIAALKLIWDRGEELRRTSILLQRSVRGRRR